jgi:hypothetical protein
MKEKTTFTSSFANLTIKPMVSEEKDVCLALASLVEVGKFLPDIDAKANRDLLPVAFNACVVNRVNKNMDVIDTKTAIAMYKQFINKPVNLEHNRQKVTGVILTAGFSEFGSDKPLTEAEASQLTSPFNITLGGVVWRTVNPDFSSLVEDSSDPSSENYLCVSASWELSFTDYEVVLMEPGKKNLNSAAKIITDEAEIEAVRQKLVSLGGDGKNEEFFLFRKPSENVLPTGIGFTQKPAAEVKGVATPAPEAVAKTEITKDSDSQVISDIKNEKIEENNSQAKESPVKGERTYMKITSLKDITDETLKTATASAVADFIGEELKKGSEVWKAEQTEVKKALATAEEANKVSTAEILRLTEELKKVQDAVAAFNKEKQEREAVETFNARMGQVSEAFELDAEARTAIVEDVKAIASDADFTKWFAKAQILFKGYAKKTPPPFEKKDAKDSDKKEDKKEDKKDAKAGAQETVDSALEAAAQEKGGLPNAAAGEVSLIDKARKAFALDQFTISR